MNNDLKVVTDNTQTLINAEKEIERLKCRVARLVYLSEQLYEQIYNNDHLDKLVDEIIDESPQQSLNAIRADAVDEAINVVPKNFVSKHPDYGTIDLNVLRHYVEQLKNSEVE